jgi:hypothetical protein
MMLMGFMCILFCSRSGEILGQFQVAANASPSILANDVKAWEDWIFMLTEKGQLDVKPIHFFCGALID